MLCRGAVRSSMSLRHSRSLFTRRKLVSPILQGTRNAVYLTFTIAGFSIGIYYYLDARAAAHRYLTMPILHALTSPETSHELAIKMMALGLAPKDQQPDDTKLAVKVWGKQLSSPIGLAAGLDKQAEAIDALFDLGFSYVEVGSVTPEPQPGNPRPRYFRLYDDRAVINRYGFNSDGHLAVAARLCRRLYRFVGSGKQESYTIGAQNNAEDARHLVLPKSLKPDKLLAINLGKNKNGDEVTDYTRGVRALGKYADVLVINVSSPNTPGLRQLQHGDALHSLLQSVVSERNEYAADVPICVKIAPDLSEPEIACIADIIKENRIEGCIISNTTITRPSSLTPHENITQAGGLSGPALKPLTMTVLRSMREKLGSSCTLIACGGVTTGKDVLEYGMAGATFVQGYTGFGYDGPGYARRLKDELSTELGGRSWVDIIGTAA